MTHEISAKEYAIAKNLFNAGLPDLWMEIKVKGNILYSWTDYNNCNF